MRDAAASGAGRVLGLWIVGAAIVGAIWRMRITAPVEAWFLLCMFLGASAVMSPVYGGLVYFGARRRELARAARGAGIATIALFVLGLVCSGYLLWFVKAVGGIR